MSLVARHLESIGLPTVCIASALDIVQSGQPPRTLFVDYPLGHTTGVAFDGDGQRRIVSAALACLESVTTPGEIVTLPVTWPGPAGWRSEAVSEDRGDTRQPRDTTPRYQFDEDRLLAEANGAQAPTG